MPVHLCLATRTIKARLVIRHTTPGTPTKWPLAVIDKCPWTPWDRAGHAHVHYLCEPTTRWLRTAPCNNHPYMIAISA